MGLEALRVQHHPNRTSFGHKDHSQEVRTHLQDHPKRRYLDPMGGSRGTSSSPLACRSPMFHVSGVQSCTCTCFPNNPQHPDVPQTPVVWSQLDQLALPFLPLRHPPLAWAVLVRAGFSSHEPTLTPASHEASHLRSVQDGLALACELQREDSRLLAPLAPWQRKENRQAVLERDTNKSSASRCGWARVFWRPESLWSGRRGWGKTEDLLGDGDE